MKFLFMILSCIALSVSAFALEPDEILENTALETRARVLSSELRCVVCQNQNIDESDADIAKDMRLLLRERLLAGDSDKDVKDFFVARYGDFVLFKPRFSLANVALWCVPFLAFALGLLLWSRGLKRKPEVFLAGQLAGVARDKQQGFMSEEQAQAANREVKRRMRTVEAQDIAGKSSPFWLLFVFVGCALFASAGLYRILGQAGMPSMAYEDRLLAPASEDLPAQAVRLERLLRVDPEDSDHWAELAELRLAMGETEAALTAMMRSVQLDMDNANKHARFGGMMLELSEEGPVPKPAAAALKRAFELNSGEPLVHYYMGKMALRDGRGDIAVQFFERLLPVVKSDPGLTQELQGLIAKAQQSPEKEPPGTLKGPNAEDMAAAALMSEEDRNAMIVGMVEGLAARLEEAPEDLEGWRRLIRAYGVLGEEEKRKEAMAALLALLPEASAEAQQLRSILNL